MLTRYRVGATGSTLQSLWDIAFSGAGEGRSRCPPRETPGVCAGLGSAARSPLYGVPPLHSRRRPLAHRGDCLPPLVSGLGLRCSGSLCQRTASVLAQRGGCSARRLGLREVANHSVLRITGPQAAAPPRVTRGSAAVRRYCEIRRVTGVCTLKRSVVPCTRGRGASRAPLPAALLR